MRQGKHRSVLILVLTAICVWAGGAYASDPATWPVVFEDDFTDPGSGWRVGEDENATHRYVDGGYEVVVHNPWRFSHAWLPEDRDYLDFAIEVEAHTTEGQGEWGVILRWDGNAAYFVTLGTDGRYRLRLRQAGAWRTLADWTSAPGFREEGANQLTLVAQGFTFTAWLNGELLTSFTDETARGGLVALVVGTMETGAHGVRFERVAVREDLEVRARAEEAAALSKEALARYEAWELAEAARLFREALDLYRELEWRNREADTLLALGNCYYLLDDYRGSIELYEEALAIRRDIGDRSGEAASLIGLGNCYSALGDYPRAMALHEEALAIFVAIGDRSGEAWSLNVLGVCYERLGDYRRAMALHEEALAIRREIGNRSGEAWSLANLGNCYSALGDYPRAIELHDESLAISREIGDRPGEASSLVNLGNCYYALGDYLRAIERYEAALEVIAEIGAAEGYATGDPETLWRLHNGLAFSHRALGDLAPAASSWTQAVNVVEELRGWLGNPDHMASFMREKFTLYHNLVTTLTTLDRPYEALFYAERAKARTLVDMMDTAMALRRDELPPELQEPAELVVALGALEARAADPLAGTLVATERTGTERAAQRTRQELEAIQAKLRAENEILSTLLSVDPAQIQAYMNTVQTDLGETTVVLEYFVTADETLLWVITRDGIQTVHRIPISRSELASQVRQFRDELHTVPKPGDEATRILTAPELGQSLYDLLVSPAEAHLPENGHLVIVPSDVLFYVPFGALYRCPGCTEARGGKYLIEHYTLSYAPSLASLYWPLQRRGDGTYNSILSVGADPDPKHPLPASVNEATTVAGLFPRGDLLVEGAATEARVKGLLQTTPYDVVHLSTHGRFDQEIPLVSHVQLLPGGDEDGNLHAGEFLGLTLGRTLADGTWAGCKLVVLSACQTALPPDIEEALVVGDELQGLSQALFVAGTPSAVLTLWNVNDRSTSVLMAGAGKDPGFYAHLMRGETKAEALRQAQLLLLRSEIYRHPYYWAAFVLYGDWR